MSAQRVASGLPLGIRETRDCGSVSLELVVIAPALLGLILGIIAAGRLALAHQSVDFAAAQAAREASLATSPGAAAASGRQRAATALAAQDLQCASTSVTVSAAALANPAGTPGSVSATVHCRVRLSDLAVPGLPGAINVTATSAVPIDQWRSAR